jgi:hypothetical protein
MSATNKRHESVSERDLDVARVMRNKSRRSFLVLGVSAAAGIAGWNWLTTRPQVGGLPYPLRRALEFNEALAENYFEDGRQGPAERRFQKRRRFVCCDPLLRSDAHMCTRVRSAFMRRGHANPRKMNSRVRAGGAYLMA